MTVTSIWLDNVVVYSDLPFQSKSVIFSTLSPRMMDVANHVSAPKGSRNRIRKLKAAETDPYQDLRMRILGAEERD